MTSLNPLFDRLNTAFAEPLVFDQAAFAPALTHSSVAGQQNYQRLEFLGDRVLALGITLLVMQLYPDSHEGGLDKRVSAMVNRTNLAKIAEALQLSPYIRIKGNDVTESVAADVVEAIIGYLYLEHGFDVVTDFLRYHWLDQAEAMQDPPSDPRSLLQEWTMQHQQDYGQPEYRALGRSGSDHAPEFVYQVSVRGLGCAEGHGGSKQAAKASAAKALLAHPKVAHNVR